MGTTKFVNLFPSSVTFPHSIMLSGNDLPTKRAVNKVTSLSNLGLSYWEPLERLLRINLKIVP